MSRDEKAENLYLWRGGGGREIVQQPPSPPSGVTFRDRVSGAAKACVLSPPIINFVPALMEVGPKSVDTWVRFHELFCILGIQFCNGMFVLQ